MREQNADCSGIIATSICFAMRRRDGNGSFWPCSLFLLLFAAKDQSSVDLARTYGTRHRAPWEANVAYDYGNFIVFLKTHHRQKISAAAWRLPIPSSMYAIAAASYRGRVQSRCGTLSARNVEAIRPADRVAARPNSASALSPCAVADWRNRSTIRMPAAIAAATSIASSLMSRPRSNRNIPSRPPCATASELKGGSGTARWARSPMRSRPIKAPDRRPMNLSEDRPNGVGSPDAKRR